MGDETIVERKSVGDVEQAQVDVDNGSLSHTKDEIEEAAALYGDREVAAKRGYVHRGWVPNCLLFYRGIALTFSPASKLDMFSSLHWVDPSVLGYSCV